MLLSSCDLLPLILLLSSSSSSSSSCYSFILLLFLLPHVAAAVSCLLMLLPSAVVVVVAILFQWSPSSSCASVAVTTFVPSLRDCHCIHHSNQRCPRPTNLSTHCGPLPCLGLAHIASPLPVTWNSTECVPQCSRPLILSSHTQTILPTLSPPSRPASECAESLLSPPVPLPPLFVLFFLLLRCLLYASAVCADRRESALNALVEERRCVCVCVCV